MKNQFVLFGLFLLSFPASAGQLVLDSAGLNIGGKMVESGVISKTVTLDRNQEEDAFIVGAALKTGQKALFELEIQDRSGWNNGDAYYCTVKELGTPKEIGVRPTLPLIDISQYGNVTKTTNTARLTSGTRSWAYYAGNNDGALLMYQVTCGGHRYGAEKSSIFVRVRKTIFE